MYRKLAHLSFLAAGLALAIDLSIAPYSSELTEAVWTVDSIPELDVEFAGTVHFASIIGGSRLASGGFLIANQWPNQVYLLSNRGNLVRTIGGGRDSETFRAISWAGKCGKEGLLVWDPGRWQATFVDQNGAITRQFIISADTITTSARLGSTDRGQRVDRLFPLSLACSSSGDIAYTSAGGVSTQVADAPEVANIWRSEGFVVRIDKDGFPVSRIGPFPVGEFVQPVGRPGAFVPRPFSPQISVAFAGQRLIVAPANIPSVIAVSDHGARETIAVPVPSRPLSNVDRENVIHRTLVATHPNFRDRFESVLAALPTPKKLPSYYGVLTDPSELLWLQLTPPGSAEPSFAIINVTGDKRWRIKLPMALTVLEIGLDYVLGTYPDSHGQTHLALLKLHRT